MVQAQFLPLWVHIFIKMSGSTGRVLRRGQPVNNPTAVGSVAVQNRIFERRWKQIGRHSRAVRVTRIGTRASSGRVDRIIEMMPIYIVKRQIYSALYNTVSSYGTKLGVQ